MTRNLAIGCGGSGSTYSATVSSKSLTSSDSNVDTGWSTPTDLLSTAANSSDPGGYTTAAIQCDSTYGAWYNYAAATAGTISGSSNSTDASKDICPSGWRLPTKDEFSAIASSASLFNPVTGGYYESGNIASSRIGFWWTSTAYDTTQRYYRNYMSDAGMGWGNKYRYVGYYVRCVKS